MSQPSTPVRVDPAPAAGADRRMADLVLAPVAALISTAVAGLTFARWLDSGAVAVRGPAVLLTLPPAAPDRVPGLGWVRLLAVLTIAALVAAVAATALAAAVAAAPARAAAPAWAGGLHAAAAVAGFTAVVRLRGWATPALAAVVLLLAAGAVGWGLVWLRLWLDRGGPAARLGWLVGPVALVLVAAIGAGTGAGWLVDGRYVRHSTSAEPAPRGGDTGPATPGQLGWRRPGVDRVYVAGGYAVLIGPGEGGRRVAVADPDTGRIRWSYQHSDAYVDAIPDPVSGVLMIRVDRRAKFLHAFDLRTGQRLWSDRDAGGMLSDSLDISGHAQSALPGGLLVLGDGPAGLRGVDPRTGRLRWRLPDPSRCLQRASVRAAGELLLFASYCPDSPLLAVRRDTGAVAWTAQFRTALGGLRAGDRVQVAAGVAGVLVTGKAGDTTLAAVDLRDGRVLWRRPTKARASWLQGPPVSALDNRFVLLEPVGRPARPVGRPALRAFALDPRTGRVAHTADLPAAPPPTPGETSTLTVADAQRLYLLTQATNPGPGSVRLEVVDGAGRLLGSATFDGCASTCGPHAVPPINPYGLRVAGGTLLMLPAEDPLAPAERGPLIAIRDGPGFTPAAR
ncbi:MAG TPA: PQQ-binding-like beta-propeller repeat protein [Mycobacteriales bacterium]|nr:PQQ-binding-like beta-propeller repeat protein [Mycobacteriales bacterium]